MQLQTPTESRAEQIIRLAQLRMVSEREGDVHTLSLTGEVDLANAAQVDRELRRIEATDVEVILVDLLGVSFIDSTGMKVLITAATRSRATNRLVIQCAGPAVLRVLHIAGIADRLPLVA
jgi:anti-sigma B factor antagonist